MPATDSQIALPFIVVNTKKETVVDCEMAEDKQVREQRAREADLTR